MVNCPCSLFSGFATTTTTTTTTKPTTTTKSTTTTTTKKPTTTTATIEGNVIKSYFKKAPNLTYPILS
jgi:hypothetical protein